MSLFCKICENRFKVQKKKHFFDNKFVSTTYCSFRCQFASFRFFLLPAGLFFFIAYFAIAFPLFNRDSDLWFLFIIMFPIIFFALILIVAGLISIVIYSRIRRELKLKKYHCFYCGYDVTLSSKKGSLLCDSCGNKVLYCNLCSKIINPNEEIARIKPCNHIFHKSELLDFVEEEKYCPKCKSNIAELSFEIDKNDEEFWIKAK
jgi:hypothetical protein